VAGRRALRLHWERSSWKWPSCFRRCDSDRAARVLVERDGGGAIGFAVAATVFVIR